MSFVETSFQLVSTNRTDVRKEVINRFLLEEPGTGKGDDCSKYWYTVEAIQGYSVLLKRPVPLNKGFDFTVNVIGMYFKKNRRYSNPSHEDIAAALNYVRVNNHIGYLKVKSALTQIYNCQPYEAASLQNISFVDFDSTSHPIEIILLAIKWLFIEQDIRYWNWSGRDMLWNRIKDI